MLKKLRLDQTKLYEKCLIFEEISQMLLSFVNGRPHHLAIGAEQGNIDKWDDIVIQTNNGNYVYLQAKRQFTDFSSDPIIRNKNRNGLSRKLSPIDQALKSLGNRINNSLGLQAEFWLELPEIATIQIKKNLEIRHLRYLCENQITSVTTSDDLSNLAQNDPNVQNIYLWLTTWCDFTDWEHILKTFKVLKTKTSGTESDIVDRARKNLSQIFLTTEIDTVKRLIFSYLDENSTYAGSIQPRQLLYLLKDYLCPTIPRWTQFQKDESGWNISGINDIENNLEIERPSVIVPALWNLDNSNVRILKIDGTCDEKCIISIDLMRLSLHTQGSFDIHCCDKSSWKNSIRNKTGGTIGVSANDFNDERLLNVTESFTTSESETKKLTTVDAQDDYGKMLRDEMYKITFKLLEKTIQDKIQVMVKSVLRTELENRWMTWKQSLETSVEEQRKLFSKILHPEAEGQSISGELRVGPKTVNLLGTAVFFLLVVSVCLGDEDNQKWQSVTEKLKMTAIGLAYWSGPADGSKEVIEIDDDVGISRLLEKERYQIIIIPQSTLSDTEIFNDDISGDITKLGLLTHPRYPRLLITEDRILKRILKTGDILQVKRYFQRSLDIYQKAVADAVDEVVA